MEQVANMYRLRDFAEERSRTLYVRLPHTIRNPKEVQELFNEDARVKLPRQSSRACHVIFSNVEEKMKGLKNLRKKKVDGKRVLAYSPRLKPLENKVSRKKIVVPIPKQKPEEKITQSLFVSNLPNKTTKEDLQKAFPGCLSVTLKEFNSKRLRSAFVKMDSIKTAREYLKKERETPVLMGRTLFIRVDTRSPKKPKAKTKKLKVYGEDGKSNSNKLEKLSSKEAADVAPVEEQSTESDEDNGESE